VPARERAAHTAGERAEFDVYGVDAGADLNETLEYLESAGLDVALVRWQGRAMAVLTPEDVQRSLALRPLEPATRGAEPVGRG
jgi:hypothetical protein